MIDIKYKTILPQTPLPIIIIGAGGIVKDAHLPAYRKAGFQVHGIVNRTKEKAVALAAEFDIPNVYDTLEDAVAQAPRDAVYDVTTMPHKKNKLTIRINGNRYAFEDSVLLNLIVVFVPISIR